MSEQVCVYQGKAVEEGTAGLFSGKIAAELQKLEDLEITWGGAQMQPELWEIIKSFMLWTYEKHATEGQLRLYYNEKEQTWGAHPMPQYIHKGLFTEEVKDSEEAEKINAKFNAMEWQYMGTVHHHCGAGAFQSGTDHKDELTKPGLHVTLGYLSRDEWDIHARCSLRGLMYTVKLEEWLPETDKIKKPGKVKFPKAWKKLLVEKPKPKYTGLGSGWKGSQLGFKGWKDDWYNSSYLEQMDKDYDAYMAGRRKTRTDSGYTEWTEQEVADAEMEQQMLVQQLENHMYLTDDSIKEAVLHSLRGMDAQDAEDCIMQYGALYDAIDQLMNYSNIEMNELLNIALEMFKDLRLGIYEVDAFTDGSIALREVGFSSRRRNKPRCVLKSDGGIQAKEGEVPPRAMPAVQCCACEGTGHQSGDKRRAKCVICGGIGFVPKPETDEPPF